MTNHERQHLVVTLAGFACGVVTGVALGVLFAPARGGETRQWITTRGREAGRRAAHFLDGTHASTIIRQSGIRGLVEVLRWRAHDREPSRAHWRRDGLL